MARLPKKIGLSDLYVLCFEDEPERRWLADSFEISTPGLLFARADEVAADVTPEMIVNYLDGLEGRYFFEPTLRVSTETIDATPEQRMRFALGLLAEFGR